MQILLSNRERKSRMIMDSDGVDYDHTFGSKNNEELRFVGISHSVFR